MKNVNFKYSALWLLLLALVTSCVFDEADPLVENTAPQDPVMVTFKLDVMSSAATKADDHTWNDNLDNNTENNYSDVIGTKFENRILPDHLQMYVYNSNGEYVAAVQRIAYREVANGDYEFWGILQKKSDVDPINADAIFYPDEIYHFVVLANCQPSSTLNGVPLPQNLIYTSTFDSSASNFSAIPMWGAVNVKLTMTDSQNIGPIQLLRSMAKVEVALSKDLTNYTIKSATITRSSNTGYSVPNFWNIRSTTSLSHLEAFRPYVESTIQTGSFFKGSDAQQVIYLPELSNTTTNYPETGDIKIELVLNDGSRDIEFKGEKAISLAEYNNGQLALNDDGKASLYNLVRNHYYHYTINKVESGKPVELTLTVKPWDVVTESIQFTDEVSVNEGDKMIWSGTKVKPGISDPSSIFIDGASSPADAAVATFKINTPVGATWYASMEGDKDAFSFIVETTSGDSNKLPGTTQKTENGVTTTVYWKKVTSVTGNVGEPSVLRIITNAPTVSENKAVSLKIAVITLDGRTIMANAELMPTELSSKEYFMIRQNLTL